MSSCRFCGAPLHHIFIDLGECPVANSFLSKEDLNKPEEKYPLRVFVCDQCWLVQIEEFKKAKEIFKEDYAYFSSYSTTWLEHAKNYVNEMMKRFRLTPDQQVIEIASNDGYLLQYFAEKKIPVLGIEPSSNTAAVAVGKGIPTINKYFGTDLANQLLLEEKQAELLIGNNVLAHVPDLNDFVKGLKIILKKGGIITMEFPHLLQMVKHCEFDTIYHEHYSYFSFSAVKKIFEKHGLKLFDVEELPTHGGSLRIYATHAENEKMQVQEKVQGLLKKERAAGILTIEYYKRFEQSVARIKDTLLEFLAEQKKEGKKVAAYGAAAKGNTLINYCGIDANLISFVVDRSPFKQGKFLPGSHIPVTSEQEFFSYQPDYILILPWNIQEEIMEQLHYVREWDCKFAIAIPELRIL